MPRERSSAGAALGELALIGGGEEEQPQRAAVAAVPPAAVVPPAAEAASRAEQPRRRRKVEDSDRLIKTSIKLRVSETDYFNGLVRQAQRENRERITASFVQRSMLRSVVELLAPRKLDLSEITMEDEDLLVDRIKELLGVALAPPEPTG